MDADQIFKRILWRGVVGISPAMERFTTWTITGVAAISALVISNLDSIGNMVSSDGLKYSIYLMVASLLFGVFSKQLGMAQTATMELVDTLQNALDSEQGQSLIGALRSDPEKLKREVAEPFWWPISWLMSKGFEAGFDDPLTADKRLVSRFCLQVSTNLAHVLLAAASLITLVVHLK